LLVCAEAYAPPELQQRGAGVLLPLRFDDAAALGADLAVGTPQEYARAMGRGALTLVASAPS
jgi:hypothetical protein